jgi:hypothetical protein
MIPPWRSRRIDSCRVVFFVSGIRLYLLHELCDCIIQVYCFFLLQVLEVDLLCADGRLLTVNEENNADLFRAARIGLGALGIIVALKIQCEPAFRLHQVEYGLPLADVRKWLSFAAFEMSCTIFNSMDKIATLTTSL